MLEERNPAGSLLDVLLAGAAVSDRPTPPVGSDASASYRPAAVPAFLPVGDADRVRLDPEPAVPVAAIRIEADPTSTSEPVARFVEFETADLIPAWVAMPAADAMAERPPAGDDGPMVEPPQAGGGAVTPATPLDTPATPAAAAVVLPPTNPGSTEKGEAGGGATTSYGPGDYNWVDIVQSAKVREVTFSGPDLITIEADPGTEAYPDPPHWVDANLDGYIDWDAGEHALPVGYPRDTNPVVSARFTPTYGKMPYLPADYDLVVRAVTQLQATLPEYFGIPWTHVSIEGNDLVLPPTVVPNPFPDYVNYGTLKLDWQFSRNGGGSWYSAGYTENELYVTLGTPVVSPVYHTVIHVGTVAAVGMTTEAGTIDKVWEKFATRTVHNKAGKLLFYYKDWTETGAANLADQTKHLLETTDGPCMAWTTFFLDDLAAQGIKRADSYWIVDVKRGTSNLDYLVIKNWEFVGAGSSDVTNATHQNRTKNPDEFKYFEQDPTTKQWAYYWGAIEEVKDRDGLPGQGKDLAGMDNRNPPALFPEHIVASIDGKIYDASYGLKHDDLVAWEQASVAGYAQPKSEPFSPKNFRWGFAKNSTPAAETEAKTKLTYP